MTSYAIRAGLGRCGWFVFVAVMITAVNALPAAAQNQDDVRVLFLGSGYYFASGGSQVPLEGYSSAAGIRTEAVDNYNLLGPGEGVITEYWHLFAKDKRVKELLEREPFDYVVFFTGYAPLLDDFQWEETVAGLRTVLEWVDATGATTVIPMSFTLKSDLDETDRVEAGFERLLGEVREMKINGAAPPVVYVPMGRFWKDATEQFGIDEWYNGRHYATPLAQYGMGCLWFTYLLDRRPKGSRIQYAVGRSQNGRIGAGQDCRC